MSDEPASPSGTPPSGTATTAAAVEASLREASARLQQSRDFAKPGKIPPVLEQVRRLILQPDGIEHLYRWAPELDRAGVFYGSDWATPQALLPGIVRHTLDEGDRQTLLIECISQLRMLAIANGDATHSGISAEQAYHFLTQVLALNLDRVFGIGRVEATRVRQAELAEPIDRLFQFLVAHIGYEDTLVNLTEEIWRILGQRPIQVNQIKSMVTQIAVSLAQGAIGIGETRLAADRLISALFGPTQGCVDDPGLEPYRQRLAAMDFPSLQQEATGFARAMHDVGLVSDYHAAFMRWLLSSGHRELIADALGLSTTGLDSLRCYSELVHSLIDKAVHPETAQAVYGLALLLERGLLYMPPIAPGLWRQIGMSLSSKASAALACAFGAAQPPEVFLLADVISVLGQPLGVGQGDNPTCQAARAISMWAYSDPDFLLHLIAQAAHNDSILMHFEGQPIRSADLPAGELRGTPRDNDAVSTLLVPHLDRIYHEMGRLCEDRGEDPHCWINPEFHGWWVGRKFAIAVDVETGLLQDFDGFLRHFFASYHPYYNGNQPVIHPQPAGLAVTDSAGHFVGWHAISLQRVALDQAGTMRVYFYNPNNDSGQDWGLGVIVSTQGNGERFGEASLPFEQLASRLYIFHDDPLASPPLSTVSEREVASARDMALASWAADREPGTV